MDIRTLRYVVTLAEELHFGRAARRHFIAAQPFGQHVQRLEREVGARLFDRTSRRVAITPAGERFVAQVRVVLAEVDALYDQTAERPSGGGGPLRVGVLGFGAGDRWGALRGAVHDQLPAIVLEHHELDLADQYDTVRRGRVDVGLVQHVGEIDGLEFEPVLSSPRVAVVPATSAMADAARLTAGDLADCHWVEVASREPSLRAWVGGAAERGAPAVRQPSAIPTAVAISGRVCVHGAAAADYYPRPDVRFVPVDGPAVEVAVSVRSGDRRPEVVAFRRAAAAVRRLTGTGLLV
ncbi:LysR family transcriptional regulator [Modestobacter roseus]|uniref:DNA-binding transcriptional LysR family regulator n=2 Tax=Modestobacter roseus TaxID=1181884 RepID=A0A562IRK9_9ACTN|nr:LysR family transcriptional regulator [Modestobacter roseus]MQA32115.1 LysR family transcriptional regulator [Modestobacter roseus]TWH73353.1 DNA-binding transcriptional LysR family regulator [Modestobacter roseus]